MIPPARLAAVLLLSMALSFLPYFSTHFKLNVCSEALRKKTRTTKSSKYSLQEDDEKYLYVVTTLVELDHDILLGAGHRPGRTRAELTYLLI
jgi:hypothetical protein